MKDSRSSGSEKSRSSWGRRRRSTSSSRSSSYFRGDSRSLQSSEFSGKRSRGAPSCSASHSLSYTQSSSADYSSTESRLRRDRKYRSHSPPERYRDSPRASKDKRIVVIGLSKNVSEGHIREIFGNFGNIVEVFMPPSRGGFSLSGYHCNRSICYVEYKTKEAAKEAIFSMHGGVIDGMDIRVEYATEPRRSFSRGYHPDSRRMSKGIFFESKDDRYSNRRFDRGYRYERARDWDYRREGMRPSYGRERNADRYSSRDVSRYR